MNLVLVPQILAEESLIKGTPPPPARIFRWIRDLYEAGIIPRGVSWLTHWLALLKPSSRRVVLTDIPGIGNFYVDLSDRGQCGYFLNRGLANERAETSLFMNVPLSFKAIFDLGAHIGFYSRVFVHSAPAAWVHAFEPNPRSFQMLRKNLESYPQVVVQPLAVADKSGVRDFFVNGCSDLSSLLEHKAKRIAVRTVSLEDYCQTQGIFQVDLIKCDVEGAEWEVLQGAKRLLSSAAPPLWLLECSSVKKRMGAGGHGIETLLKACSSQRVIFFQTSFCCNRLEIMECSPDRMSWRDGRRNLWVVPECREAAFFEMVRAAQEDLKE